MSAISSVALLPTTLYGDDVVAPIALSPATIGRPAVAAGAVAQFVPRLKFATEHRSAFAIPLTVGLVASAAAGACTAAACVPGPGAVAPSGGGGGPRRPGAAQGHRGLRAP